MNAGGFVKFLKRLLSLGQRGGALFLPDIRGYQMCYDEATRSQLDPDFEPLLNDHADRPDWFEYWPIRQFFEKAEVDESALYGFLSPKFGLKTGLTGLDVASFVESVPGADVVLFSPFPEHGACFLNVFEQQTVFDPQFLGVCQRFFRSMGDEGDVSGIVNHAENVVYSNFFFAKPSFWRLWLEVCDRLVEASEHRDQRDGLSEALVYRAGDGVTKMTQRKVFVMERVASYLLSRETNLRVAAYPITRMPHFPHSIHLAPAFYEMDRLKRMFVQTRDRTLLSRFRSLQREVLPVLIPGVSMSALPVD